MGMCTQLKGFDLAGIFLKSQSTKSVNKKKSPKVSQTSQSMKKIRLKSASQVSQRKNFAPSQSTKSVKKLFFSKVS